MSALCSGSFFCLFSCWWFSKESARIRPLKAVEEVINGISDQWCKCSQLLDNNRGDWVWKGFDRVTILLQYLSDIVRSPNDQSQICVWRKVLKKRSLLPPLQLTCHDLPTTKTKSLSNQRHTLTPCGWCRVCNTMHLWSFKMLVFPSDSFYWSEWPWMVACLLFGCDLMDGKGGFLQGACTTHFQLGKQPERAPLLLICLSGC